MRLLSTLLLLLSSISFADQAQERYGTLFLGAPFFTTHDLASALKWDIPRIGAQERIVNVSELHQASLTPRTWFEVETRSGFKIGFTYFNVDNAHADYDLIKSGRSVNI